MKFKKELLSENFLKLHLSEFHSEKSAKQATNSIFLVYVDDALMMCPLFKDDSLAFSLEILILMTIIVLESLILF